MVQQLWAASGRGVLQQLPLQHSNHHAEQAMQLHQSSAIESTLLKISKASQVADTSLTNPQACSPLHCLASYSC